MKHLSVTTLFLVVLTIFVLPQAWGDNDRSNCESYIDGLGLQETEFAGLLSLCNLANTDSSKSQFELGIWFTKSNDGMPPKYAEAAYWFEQSADKVSKAAFNLGVLYDKGLGVPADDAEASFWFKKAAEEGLPDAQYNLGIRYSFGEGLPKNDLEAVEWFEKAAEQGLANAKFNLGIKYYQGAGVAKNNIVAYKWLNQAAAQGVYNAELARDLVALKLTDEEISRAQELSK